MKASYINKQRTLKSDKVQKPLEHKNPVFTGLAGQEKVCSKWLGTPEPLSVGDLSRGVPAFQSVYI